MKLNSLLIVLVVSGNLMAQELPDFTFYGVNDFPLSRQNWAIEQDSNGVFYFGNSAGIMRFDGVQWDFIHPPVNDVVRSIFKSSEGTLYYSSNNDFGVIAADSISSFFAKSLLSKLPDSLQTGFGTVWDIKEHSGSIYFQADYHIFILKNDSISVIESNAHLRRLHLFNGKLITTKSGSGLVVIEPDGLSPLNIEDPFENVSPYIVEKAGENYLFLSREEGIYLYSNGEFEKVQTTFQDSLISHWPYRATGINENEIAVATVSGGIYIFDQEGHVTTRYTTDEGLNTNIVYDVYIDNENNLWAALDDGIIQLHSNEPNFKIDRRLNYIGLNTGLVEHRGDIFSGTTEGLYRIDPEEKTVERLKTDFSRVIDIVSFDETVLINTGEGIFELSGNKILKAEIDPIHFFKKIDDKIYLTGDQSISRLNSANGLAQTLIRFEDVQNIEDLTEFENMVWFFNSSLEVFNMNAEGEISNPYSLFHGDRGTLNFIDVIDQELRIGSSKGLYIFDKESSTFKKDSTFNDPDILNEQVFRFETCGKDSIWFRAGRQIKLSERVDGNWVTRASPFQTIGFEETVDNILCHEERTWFGTSEALEVIKNPVAEKDYSYNSFITRFYIHRDSLIYGGFGPPRQDIILPYKNNELRFQYAAASYIDTERNQYQVMLEGFDEDWSPWTSETQKDYTNIPEGEYTFRVRSKNAYDVAGIPAALSFQILPPWYRTWWAYLLYTISIAGILYAAYKIRVNQLLRVERIRNNIASDLHDEVSATLSSISYFAQAIKSKNIEGDKTRFVDLISNSAGDAKEKISDIVWAINPEHDDWTGFLSRCRRYASDLLESKDINYSLKIDEYIPGKLDMQLRQHLWLIYKEMITNAARHSEAKNLDVILKYEDGLLKLVVQDDGKGMDVDGVRKGNGLVNINKRADEIGADINLKTSEGFGTRWMLKVKI